MNTSAISNELMVAVSYTSCEYQYGRGDVTELNGYVWDAKCWPLRTVFGILSFPEITLELVPKPATFFQVDVKSRHLFALTQR